jgi:parallel beta-helix repeat protein
MKHRGHIIITFIITIFLITNFYSASAIEGANRINVIENSKLDKAFHDYNALTSELQEIANNYSSISTLYNIGQSVLGRTIWGLKISDNPNIEENEPEVRMAGCHHGNEYMSVELPLLLAWHLVENYTIDPDITDLINNREIWIIPLVNPDGRQAGSRYNSNGVDLNRDYGYMWDGSGSSPSPFSQPETQVIRNHALDNNFVFSLSFHTTAAYVNYIWNYKPQPAPDDDVIVLLSDEYASSSGYTSIRGYDWYQVRGDTNDFSYGCVGGIDTTIETANSNIELTWNKNRDAMINIIDAAGIGLHGVIKGADTLQPINATVWVEEAYWPCFNDPYYGDYHKPLLPGNYTVHYRANGYQEQVHTVEITAQNESESLSVFLSPAENYYAYQVTWCDFYDPYSYPNNFQNNPTEGISALGAPDQISASLGKGGEIVLDMGNEAEIFNGPGDDFIVYEADSTPDGYDVYASENWKGPWNFIGTGSGNTSFNLDSAGMTKSRYIKIEDDGDGSAYDTNPGFDLDAIQTLNLNESDIIFIDDNYNISTPGWQINRFNLIQDGINVADDNTTILVFDGVYYEHLIIDKKISLIGENKYTTIIDGSNSGTVISLTSDEINLSNFTIQNCGSYPDVKILINTNNNFIKNNVIANNGWTAIYLKNSSFNTISDNIIQNNIGESIYLDNSTNNKIFSNLINNNLASFQLKYLSNYNEIYENNIYDNVNTADGLFLSNSNFNKITDNIIENNSIHGIHLYQSEENEIQRNTIKSNHQNGIVMYSASDGNTISYNTVHENNILNSTLFYGINIYDNSDDNSIYYNNIIDNKNMNSYDECINNWFTDQLNHGNYWSDYDEEIEGAFDNDSNGIVDSPYINIIGGSNQDDYPLYNPLQNENFSLHQEWNQSK